ncbi:MAG: hypothetical protein GY711_33815 [bacterium]|nr:hypothetical protein [bacterium]
MVALSVVLVTFLGFSQSILSSIKLTDTDRESGIAMEAAREAIERLQAAPFGEVFARFNDTALDDPVGSVSPGATFDVDGLERRDGTAVGTISFPVTSAAPGALREDLQDPRLGTPRDLNGDNVIDAADHAVDYALVPVRVEVRWDGQSGPGRMGFRTMLASF